MDNSRNQMFHYDDAPPPPPPPPGLGSSYSYDATNPLHSHHSSKPYQAHAYIQPRNSGNPEAASSQSMGSNGGMAYLNGQSGSEYSAYHGYTFPPPPPPPPPPNFPPHSAPPPPPPPEPQPLFPAQHDFQNQFIPQSGGPRPPYRPQNNSGFRPGAPGQFSEKGRRPGAPARFASGGSRPRAPGQFSERGPGPRAQFSERGSGPRAQFSERGPGPRAQFAQRGPRPRSQFQAHDTRPRQQRQPESKHFSPRFQGSSGPRFQSPQNPRDFRAGGPRQPNNSFRKEGPPRFAARNQNTAPLLSLHIARFGHNRQQAPDNLEARVARNPPGVSNGSEGRVARNPSTSRFSENTTTAGSLLPPWKPVQEPQDLQPDPSQPLKPPPMPPMFTWNEAEIKPPDSIAELKLSEPDLPFLPVPMEKIDLVQMGQVMEKQQAESNGATISNLVKEGSILAHWPQELKEKFQPLYCKLCCLTLSSAIVAMDHYKGKKHHKKIEVWFSERRQGGNHRVAVSNFIRPSDSGSRVPPISPEFPISGSNCTPLGTGFPLGGSIRPAGRKRAPSDAFHNPSGVSKNFPLGRPPKKPKNEPSTGGRNFDYCHLCSVALTSLSHAEQHYAGKPHTRKLLGARVDGKFGDDPRFGIGQSFTRRSVLPIQTPAPTPVTENSRPLTPMAFEDFQNDPEKPLNESGTTENQHTLASENFSIQQLPVVDGNVTMF